MSKWLYGYHIRPYLGTSVVVATIVLLWEKNKKFLGGYVILKFLLFSPWFEYYAGWKILYVNSIKLPNALRSDCVVLLK